MVQLRKQCLLRKCPSSSERDPSFSVRPSRAVCRKLSWQREPCPDDPGCGCLCHIPHPTQTEGSELKTKDPSSGSKPTQKYLVSEGQAGRSSPGDPEVSVLEVLLPASHCHRDSRPNRQPLPGRGKNRGSPGVLARLLAEGHGLGSVCTWALPSS